MNPPVLAKVVSVNGVLLEESVAEIDLQTLQPSSSSFTHSYFDEQGAREYMTRYLWPEGFQEEFLRSLDQCPMRFFIVDDSGSMHTSDAVRIHPKGDSAM